MDRQQAFEFLDRVARGIAETFGPACETLVQDFDSPSHPILSIYNSQVSGREVGSTLDILGSDKLLDANAQIQDFVNLYAATPTGAQIKSSTFHLMGADYNLALGINFDYSPLAYANRTLVELMNVQADLRSALWQEGDSKQLSQLFDQCMDVVGKPVSSLTKKDRLRVITLLEQHNAFSYRKAVPYVAQHLGVSRYTVYKYLGELAEKAGEGVGAGAPTSSKTP